MKLSQDFYNRCVVEVAKDLIGKMLVCGQYSGIITETEAYRGCDDEAAHAYNGKTKRTEVMFGPPGHAYVYISYGIHHCLNIVTGPEGKASGVLIRGVKLPDIHLDGPGKVCKYLGITKKDYGTNVVQSDHLYLAEGIEVKKIAVTPRIGITKAADRLWRFVADIDEIRQKERDQ